MDDAYARLAERARLATGEDRAAKRQPGALSPRERCERLFDPGTFKEIARFAQHDSRDFGLEKKRFLGDGIVTGCGRIAGREVFVHATDWTALAGTWGRRNCEKIVDVCRLAGRTGAPVVSLMESGGARLQDGVHSMEATLRAFAAISELSGVVPQVTAVLGSCIGAAALGAVAADFVGMLSRGSICMAGPEVVRMATGESVDEASLGGSEVHLRTTGHATAAFETEDEVLDFVREVLSFLPQNNTEAPPITPNDDPPARPVPELLHLLPKKATDAFDIRELIRAVVDEGHFFETQAEFARNGVCGFARFGGRPVGIIANQSMHLSGAVDVDVTRKFVRFLNTLGCFNVPLVSFVDAPGVLPGIRETHRGSIGWGAQLAHAFCSFRPPRLSLIVRRCFGGAWVFANTKGAGGDLVYAYPTALVGPMSPEALGQVVFRAGSAPDAIEAMRRELTDPFVAAGHGYVDDVIHPQDTRREICRAVELLQNKRVLGSNPRRRDNMPL